MTGILLTALIFSVVSCVISLTDVQISSCNVPIRGTVKSLCCFTSNLPTGASIYISKNSNHVIRISQSCQKLWVSENFTDGFTGNCTHNGNSSTYSIVLTNQTWDSIYSQSWECGFYGNKSKMVVTEAHILDENINLRGSPGENRTLLRIRSSRISPSLVKLYKLEFEYHLTTLLLVDRNNTPVTYVSWLHFTGNFTENNYTVDLIGVEEKHNGTYVFEVHSSEGVSRYGVTLIVNKNPTSPTLNTSSDWKLSENKASGSVVCVSHSQSAAPLYFNPDLKTKWRLPGDSDWSSTVGKYTVVIENNTAFISGVDCTKPTLPIYCTTMEIREQQYFSDSDFHSILHVFVTSATPPLVSHSSHEFDPRSMCEILGFNEHIPFKGDPWFRAYVITVCVFVTVFVFSCVITIVVARHFLKKKLKRCGRKCRKCCTCCAKLMPSSSDSDSDSDYQSAIRNSRHDTRRRTDEIEISPNENRRRRGETRRSRSGGGLDRNGTFLNLADGLQSQRSSRIDNVLEQIALEESRFQHGAIPAIDDVPVRMIDPASFDVNVDDDPPGAVGGVGISNHAVDAETQLLIEAESLLHQHHRHLTGDPVRLTVSRDDIINSLLSHYSDENVALSRVDVHMEGEDGLDYGGVAFDMFTTFWNRAIEEQYFLGSDRVVPHLHPHRLADEDKFRKFGRILSHSIAVLQSFPLPLCKSTIITMVFETTDVSPDMLIEDFLYFLDEVDRSLVTSAIEGFQSLTDGQKDELGTIFERYDYAVLVSADNFLQHLTQLARHTLCIKPKSLLDKMRSGIPHTHLTHFWSNLHHDALSILYRVLEPSPERVIARLKPYNVDLSRKQERVLNYLKDFLKETTNVELGCFLTFVTGKKSMPRQEIKIAFTTDRGTLRTPRAHTCSSMMELPETYENYDTFRSEFKHLLASDEAQQMTMA